MPTLVIVGLGYSATRFLAEVSGRFDRLVATVRDPARAKALSATGIGRIALEVVAFDGTRPAPRLAAALRDATALLVSAPPGPDGDPLLRLHGTDLLVASELGWIGYLSTIGVYGDHAGGWVDETTPCAGTSQRARERLAAEAAWSALGEAIGAGVGLFRLGGIYGPGQNALVQVRAGTARRIVKPGQVFNRIHVDDIAGALAAGLDRPDVTGPINVVDDEPAPPQDVIAYAAKLLGLPPPPEMPWELAAPTMSPMALAFYSETRRVRNARLRRVLRYDLRYSDYRAGLEALFAAGEGR